MSKTNLTPSQLYVRVPEEGFVPLYESRYAEEDAMYLIRAGRAYLKIDDQFYRLEPSTDYIPACY